MTERKWTPGPWSFDDENSVVDTEGHEVCWDATEPDAHLIAAAPELYEALERLMVECVLDGRENEAGYDFWIHHAKSAIRKARGES